MQLFLLSERPELIPTLARWYFDEWGHEVMGNSYEKEISKLSQFLIRDQLPLSIVAIEGEEVLGAAQLKFREMSIYPEKEHWLGAVYVAPEYRGRGLATVIIKEIIKQGIHFEVPELYLQTEHLDGGLYHKLGWVALTQVNYEGIDVLVMKKSLSF